MTYAELRAAWEKEKLAPHEAKDKPRPRVPNLAGHADVAPLYGPDDLEGFDPVQDLGVPGAQQIPKDEYDRLRAESLAQARAAKAARH